MYFLLCSPVEVLSQHSAPCSRSALHRFDASAKCYCCSETTIALLLDSVDRYVDMLENMVMKSSLGLDTFGSVLFCYNVVMAFKSLFLCFLLHLFKVHSEILQNKKRAAQFTTHTWKNYFLCVMEQQIFEYVQS